MQLVSGEGELALGRMLRQKYAQTQDAVLQVRAPEQGLPPRISFLTSIYKLRLIASSLCINTNRATEIRYRYEGAR
jgi:hypothetical protein